VNQFGGLQGMPGRLIAQVATRHAAQVVIDQWHQLVERRLIPLSPFNQPLRNLIWRYFRHYSCFEACELPVDYMADS